MTKTTSSTADRRAGIKPLRSQDAPSAPTHKNLSARPKLRSQAAALQRFGRAQSSVAMAQGACYMAMGLWPLTHMQSFEWFTGPKHNAALMQVLGALLAVIGIILLLGSLQKVLGSTTCYLGAGVAGVLALLAVVFVATARMPPVYLFDAALESAFVIWWLVAHKMTRSALQRRRSQQDKPTLFYTTILPRSHDDTLH